MSILSKFTSKLKATFTRAKDKVNEKMLSVIPASKASRIAKAMVLALTFMFAIPMQAHAAGFITEAINILSVVIIAIGGGLGIWGVVNLLEGYGNDNPGAKSQGIKQLMAGLGLILIGLLVIPQLETLLPTA